MSHLTEIDRQQQIAAALLTVSDSRTAKEDRSGALIRQKLEESGHVVRDYQICMDEPEDIREVLAKWLTDETIEAIIVTGGTGIGHRDVTIETVTPYFTKELTGFGELFRYLSYTEDVGSKALLSRATAGAVQEQAVFLLPGSSKAVALAMDKLILPELHHIVHELTKHRKE